MTKLCELFSKFVYISVQALDIISPTIEPVRHIPDDRLSSTTWVFAATWCNDQYALLYQCKGKGTFLKGNCKQLGLEGKDWTGAMPLQMPHQEIIPQCYAYNTAFDLLYDKPFILEHMCVTKRWTLYFHLFCFVCPSVHPSVHLYVCLYAPTYMYVPSARLSVSILLSVSVSMPVGMSFCLPVRIVGEWWVGVRVFLCVGVDCFMPTKLFHARPN